MNIKENLNNDGIALVAVLAILTVLAILASTMSVLIGIEQKSAKSQLESQKVDLIIDSGIEHAKAILEISQGMDTKLGEPNKDYLFEEFGTPIIHINNPNSRNEKSGNSRKSKHNWYYIYDENGVIQGRYEIIVEDEASKINLNSAALLEKSKGSGWNTSEISLPHALGISPKNAKKILEYRYGANKVPGMRGDDDKNNIFLMSDGIDNNANGIIDEFGEGIDDPGEYNFKFPKGDDKVYSTLIDAATPLFSNSGKNMTETQRQVYKEFPRRATLYSVDYPGSATLPNDQPADINSVTARQCRRRLIKANKLIPFESKSTALNQLAANIVDYRDQNHVLSTIGGSYGVEAICFNELLANDGTQGRTVKDSTKGGYSDKEFVFAESSIIDGTRKTYELKKGEEGKYYKNSKRAVWDVKLRKVSAGKASVELLGPAQGENSKTLWPSANIRKYKEFRDARKDIGDYRPKSKKYNDRTYNSLTWPRDFFKNAFIVIANTKKTSSTAIGDSVSDIDIDNKIGKITSSTRDGEITFKISNSSKIKNFTNTVRCVIHTWANREDSYVRGFIPGVNNGYIFQGLEKNTYYLPVINNWPSSKSTDKMPRMGFAPYNELSSDNREHKDHKWQYGGIGKDAISVRTSKSGRMEVYVRSGDNVKIARSVAEHEDWGRSCNNWSITFVRPEVIELININPNPISIHNWTLTFNSGSIANDIGIIDYGLGYGLNGKSPDANPVIAGNGYFYLVNNLPLFKSEFYGGEPNFSWGNNAGQENPVWEIPADSWGVQYKIKDASANGAEIKITLENERWRSDQFKGEIFEATRRHGDGKIVTATGSRYEIQANGPDWIKFIAGGSWDAEHFKPSGGASWAQPAANQIMILGLPAKGGVVSMTLKNEYNQIVSRTIDYGYLDSEPKKWFGRSTEKSDPTHYNWTVNRQPTISGKKEKAINKSMLGKVKNPAYVKDGPFVSAAELKKIRTADDFVNIGSGKGKAKRAITSLLGVFGNSSIRLEASDQQAERKGWELAEGVVGSCSGSAISSTVGNWQNGQWENHTLRFTTGKLAGESFPIFDNSKRQLKLTSSKNFSAPKSVPGRKSLRPNRGDRFSIGPGYNSPLCYTRKSNKSGEWYWKQKVPVKGTYNFYIFGLNDAINTTEFLEENYNSPLDIELWNFNKDKSGNDIGFENLCQRKQYLKEDCFYAGKIKPENISDEGGVKMKIISHDVLEIGLKDAEKQGVKAQKRTQTGYAWFNYAVITPVPVLGRVNVNTAPKRLLSSLPGISSKLANNIVMGINNNGKPILKPYKKLGDLLNVQGMTVDKLERCANLLCLNTSSYTLNINAQTISDINEDGKFDEKQGDKIEANRNVRCILVLNPGKDGKNKFKVIEKIPQTYAQ